MSAPAKSRTVQRFVKGLPYLKKEVQQELSLRLGGSWATPASYYVIVTRRCNSQCTFCWITSSCPPDSPELPGEVMLRIVRESKELSRSGYNMSVSGGEPLLYRPIYEALGLAHRLGVDMGITTNGSLLTVENIKRIAGTDPFNINISLESVDPAINEQLRPTPGGTRRALQAIENLFAEKERSGARFGIFVKPTVMEQNYRSLPQMVRYFGKSGAVQVNPQSYYLVPEGERFWVQDPDHLAEIVEELVALREEGYGLVPSPQTLRDMVTYFRSPPRRVRQIVKAGKQSACRVGFHSLFINPDGMAFFCEPLGAIGNVLTMSLRDVWYGPEARRKRDLALQCAIDCQISCRRPISLYTKVRAFLRMG